MIARAAISALFIASVCAAAPPRELSRVEYADRLHAMWLAECAANWTGLTTEGRRSSPPFLTDADWDTDLTDFPPVHIGYVLDQDPWGADDDTDIEYVYLHLLTEHAPATRLTPDQIRAGWIAHVNRRIWVSNARARELMSLGARPPATSFGQASAPPSYADSSLMIDAQLTTEIFGALAPGMPEVALELADVPIRTTATGHAAHAAQLHVVLYSLATQVDRSLPASEQVVWLVREARKFIPGSSKAADICDFVLADYLANPDKSNWELTRDRVYQRYQQDAIANGFVYRAWYESSVNLATGLIALLYGELDLGRTIRIGTLSGWDSDNGTATMGGLVGLILGTQATIAQFPGWTPSDRYWAGRTRDNLPDHLPLDAAADDTLMMMAERCVPIVERVIVEAGGRTRGGDWLLPPGGAGDGLAPPEALERAPTHRDTLRSANVAVRISGGTVTAYSSVPGSPGAGYGSWWTPYMGDGLEYDFRGLERQPGALGQYSTQRAVATPDVQSLAISYSQAVDVRAIRFIEGDHYTAARGYAYEGGWFESIGFEVWQAGAWTPVTGTLLTPLDQAEPFQTLEFVLAQPTMTTGIRISGMAGGAPGFRFVSVLELDALLPAPPEPSGPRSFDLNADGEADAEDLYRWHGVPADLNADGRADAIDAAFLRRALRWDETDVGGRP